MFEQPVENQDVEILVEKGLFWGFWKNKFFVKGRYLVVARIIEQVRKGKI